VWIASLVVVLIRACIQGERVSTDKCPAFISSSFLQGSKGYTQRVTLRGSGDN